jgi:hypothetical protein
MKRLYEAQAAKAPEDEIERLRLEAENLLRAVSEFQERVMGRRDDIFHWWPKGEASLRVSLGARPGHSYMQLYQELLAGTAGA